MRKYHRDLTCLARLAFALAAFDGCSAQTADPNGSDHGGTAGTLGRGGRSQGTGGTGPGGCFGSGGLLQTTGGETHSCVPAVGGTTSGGEANESNGGQMQASGGAGLPPGGSTSGETSTGTGGSDAAGGTSNGGTSGSTGGAVAGGSDAAGGTSNGGTSGSTGGLSGGLGGNAFGGAPVTGGVGGSSGAAGGLGAAAATGICEARGTHCDLESDCQPLMHCVDSQCQLGAGLNEPCSWGWGCQDTLRCANGKCLSKSGLCGSDSDCLPPESCIHFFNSSLCVAQNGTSDCFLCTAPTAGSRCAGDGDCPLTQYCSNTVGVLSFCTDRLPQNGRCTFNGPEHPCQQGLWCAPKTLAILPTILLDSCQPFRAEGEPCESMSYPSGCANGLVCDPIAQLCRAEQVGDRCVSGCSSQDLFCSNFVCVNRSHEGEACVVGQCDEGFYCPNRMSDDN